MKRLKCDHGDYRAPIDGPYGIGMMLALKVAEWHERGHKGHKVSVVEEDE